MWISKKRTQKIEEPIKPNKSYDLANCYLCSKELAGASKKGVIKQNLAQYLLSKKEIKDFVQQLNKKEPKSEGKHPKWEDWKYYVYKPVIDRRNDADYLIIFFLDDNNPELIGVITVYPYE